MALERDFWKKFFVVIPPIFRIITFFGPPCQAQDVVVQCTMTTIFCGLYLATILFILTVAYIICECNAS